MPQASSLYQSPLLSQIAVDFKNRDYIADKILTPVQVPKMLGQYLVWDKGITFKRQRTEMAQDGTPNRIDLKATKTPFSLNTHALMASVDPLERDQAPEAQIEAMKVSKLANALLLDREIRVAQALVEPTQYGSNTDDLSGNDLWSDVDSDPVRAVMEAHDTLPKHANKFVTNRAVISALRVHPKILEALQFTSSSGLASLEQLARLFEVDEILIGDAFVDTAGDGLAEDKELVWQEASGTGGMALLCYVDPSPPSPLMDQPTIGYLPTMGGGQPTMQTYRWVEPGRGTAGGVTNIKVETHYKPLISAPSMGFLWTSVLS
jgi:hypothetical protein